MTPESQPTTVDGSRPAVAPIKPLDPPMTPLAIGGIVLWAVAGVVLWIAGAPSTWLWICVAGVIAGFPGWAVMWVHDRNRARRQA